MFNKLMFLRYSLFVAIGGSFGAVLRYWVAEFVHLFFERNFPIGTLVVNVVGSFFMGFLSIYLFNKLSFSNELRGLLLIGVLGSFTTFSTFSLDVVNLFNSGSLLLAFLNIFMSLLLCIGGASLGVWLAQ